jgi:ABC-type transporter Mla MlaB component
MLRITVRDSRESLTVQLEGRLAGPWVRELEDCWQTTRASQRKAVLRVDLTGVTFIDAAGKKFLAAMHTEGAEFLARGCLMRAHVTEITDAPIPQLCVSEERPNSKGKHP